MMWSESTIILAIVGMVGILASVTILIRANTITQRYYNKK